MNGYTTRKPWSQRLWLIAAFLFVLAAWQQPAHRGINISLAVVFGILGVAGGRRA
jgi:hypothetical protein